MKKLMLLIGVLLIAGVSAAYMYPGIHGSFGVVGSACSTPSTGDEFNEGFLGAGYENTWTENTVADEDAALPGSPPTNCCTEGVRFNQGASDDDNTRWDKGGTHDRSTDLDIVFELYVDAVTLGANQNTTILNWDNDVTMGSVGVAVVRIFNQAGTYQLYAYGSTASTKIPIALDTWYTVTLHMDGTAASSSLDVEGTTQTFTRADANDGRYLLVGAAGMAAGESLDYYIGYIYVNSP